MKIIKVLLIILAVALFGVTVVKAQTVLPRITTACEDKAGLLFSVNDGFSLLKKCPKNSRLVAIIGEKGDKGDKGDQGEQGLQGPKGDPGSSKILKVFDNNGNEIGISSTFSDNGTCVFIPSIQKIICIHFDGTVDPQTYAYYESSDCTGTFYTDLSPFWQTILAAGINIFYAVPKGTTSQNVHIYSHQEWNGSALECRQEDLGTRKMMHMEQITLPFNMPPALPLEYRYE